MRGFPASTGSSTGKKTRRERANVIGGIQAYGICLAIGVVTCYAAEKPPSGAAATPAMTVSLYDTVTPAKLPKPRSAFADYG